MGRLRTRNLRAKAKHLAEAKARSAKRWKPIIAGLDAFAARMLNLQDCLKRITPLIPVQNLACNTRFPVFPKMPRLPAAIQPEAHRPFFRPALEESMVNIRAEVDRKIRDALARGHIVNLTLDGRVIATYPPPRA